MTRKLAETLAATTFDQLPHQVVLDAERSVLDWLGAVIAGCCEPPARYAQAVAHRFGASDEATIFGSGRGSVASAAFANGVSSHTIEVDDVHKLSTLHPAAPIIPAAYAVAEREHSSGRDFLLAVTLGYEAAIRIGEAVNPSHYRYWHPTGTAATFGSAVAAGSLMKLNAKQMSDALGSAGTQAAGLWEFNADGTMSKTLHPGKAALNGVIAADLAREGFTGAGKILEGDRGFFNAMSTGADESRITDRLGELWKITENCYKLHFCCGHTHTAIDEAIRIGGEQGRTKKIARVAVETYGPGLAIVKERNPRTPFQARFSLSYCIAAALLEGCVGLAQFSADRFHPKGLVRPEIAELMSRIDITVADALTAAYPAAWPVRIAVLYEDGTVVKGAADYPKGNPENPVTNEELAAKFMALVKPRIGETAGGKTLKAIRSVVNCDDMSTLLQGIPLVFVSGKES
ncbi:MAG: MmgE/PrpD family protein [Bryobacteraceae bacterium]